MPVISCPDCGRDVSTIATACPHCGRPSPAGTAPIDTPRAPLREESLWRGGPSPMLLGGHFAGIVLVLVAVPGLTHFFGRTMPDVERGEGMIRFGWWLTGVLLVIQLIALAIAWLRLRSTTYTVTNQRVILEEGVFSKHVDEIDLRYVDDSQFFQTLLDRMLGIGNVTLISSDKSTPRYVLRSIRDPRSVRETIRTEAYQASQRQILTRAT